MGSNRQQNQSCVASAHKPQREVERERRARRRAAPRRAVPRHAAHGTGQRAAPRRLGPRLVLSSRASDGKGRSSVPAVSSISCSGRRTRGGRRLPPHGQRTPRRCRSGYERRQIGADGGVVVEQRQVGGLRFRRRSFGRDRPWFDRRGRPACAPRPWPPEPQRSGRRAALHHRRRSASACRAPRDARR